MAIGVSRLRLPRFQPAFRICTSARTSDILIPAYPLAVHPKRSPVRPLRNDLRNRGILSAAHGNMVRDEWSRLYEGMLPYHERFRATHAWLARQLAGSQSATRRDLQMIAARAGQLSGALELHHNIEETYIFPILARRQPQFSQGAEHVKEHAVMHERLEAFAKYFDGLHRRLESSAGKRAFEEGCGKLIEEGAATAEGSGGTNESARRKPWPKEVHDEEAAVRLTEALAEALLPHLAHEEESLKPQALKRAGWRLEELTMIPL